jgi:poly(A) polymerase
VTALVDGRPFEITTLRKDIACDGRHAKVEFTDDFKLDAARRDFTINAMSVDRHGQLADYFGGVADLEAGHIRFIGEARTRVCEDYLRILRFFRFYARYGRPPVDQVSLEACRAEVAGLDRISGERIRSEMLKLLGADQPIDALALMIENKVLQQILPVDIDPAPLARLIDHAPKSDALLRLAALLRSNVDPASALKALAGWRFSNVEIGRLECLVLEPLLSLPLGESEAKKSLYRLGEEAYRDLIMLSAETRGDLDKSFPIPRIPPFPITGQDLLSRKVQPGPELGKLLKELEGWWLENGLEPDRNATLNELDRRLANP